jgi:hypothetical protein
MQGLRIHNAPFTTLVRVVRPGLGLEESDPRHLLANVTFSPRDALEGLGCGKSQSRAGPPSENKL